MPWFKPQEDTPEATLEAQRKAALASGPKVNWRDYIDLKHPNPEPRHKVSDKIMRQMEVALDIISTDPVMAERLKNTCELWGGKIRLEVMSEKQIRAVEKNSSDTLTAKDFFSSEKSSIMITPREDFDHKYVIKGHEKEAKSLLRGRQDIVEHYGEKARGFPPPSKNERKQILRDYLAENKEFVKVNAAGIKEHFADFTMVHILYHELDHATDPKSTITAKWLMQFEVIRSTPELADELRGYFKPSERATEASLQETISQLSPARKREILTGIFSSFTESQAKAFNEAQNVLYLREIETPTTERTNAFFERLNPVLQANGLKPIPLRGDYSLSLQDIRISNMTLFDIPADREYHHEIKLLNKITLPDLKIGAIQHVPLGTGEEYDPKTPRESYAANTLQQGKGFTPSIT